MMRPGRGRALEWLSRRWWLAAGLVALLVLAAILWRSVGPGSDPYWQRIQASGLWRVAMDPSFPPFEDLDGAGRPMGFDVDLANFIAARWGVQVAVEGIGFDGLMDAAWAGRVDAVISAMPLQPQFSKDVAFSQPYFEAGLVLVLPADGLDVETVEELLAIQGPRLAVEWGSEGDVQARELRRRFPDLEVLPVETPQAALLAVAEGRADAALADNVSALQFAGRDGRVRISPAVVVSDPYVIVMPRKATELRRQVDQALQALQADGTLAGLRQTWFGAN